MGANPKPDIRNKAALYMQQKDLIDKVDKDISVDKAAFKKHTDADPDLQHWKVAAEKAFEKYVAERGLANFEQWQYLDGMYNKELEASSDRRKVLDGMPTEEVQRSRARMTEDLKRGKDEAMKRMK